MKKNISFDVIKANHWPAPEKLKPYFLAAKGKEWSYHGGNDSWGLSIEDLYGTEGREPFKDRVDVHLTMWGNPQFGVLLQYRKWGGGYSEAYCSKGDLNRLNEHVRTLHYDPMPIGLYIPFAEAWKAVQEFMETDGELPKSIEWIANKDLPPDTFPYP